MGKESRLHLRVLARLEAGLRTSGDDAWEAIFLRDISVGGAGVLTASLLPLQSEVRLRIDLPGEGAGGSGVLEIDSLVVRADRLPGPEQGYHHSAGLHFLAPSGKAHDRIQAYVWSNLDKEAP